MKQYIRSKQFLILILLLIVISGFAYPAKGKETAPEEKFSVITDILIEDNRVVITGSQPFTYTLYSASDPYKTTIEIPGMTTGVFKDKIASDKKGITEIIPEQVYSPETAVKLHLLLDQPSKLVSNYLDSNALSVNVQSETEVAEAGNQTPAATEISSIEIEESADTVKVLIKGDGTMRPDVFPLDGRIVVDVPDVTLSAQPPAAVLLPVKGIRAGTHRDRVRIVIDLDEKTNFEVVAIESSILISLLKSAAVVAAAPPPAAEPEVSSRAITAVPEEDETAEGQYAGKEISLDFQDADIRPIFRLLADVNGYNLVLDPSVKGTITIKLVNVPWDQALDIILNTFNLRSSLEGNILWIAPSAVFDKINAEKKKSQDFEVQAAELVQEIIRINYAESGQVHGAISKGGLLSQRGNITVDGRMNTLIINDIQENIDQIKELVKIMDVPKPQVMIEAKIVEVSTSHTESLGIRWGGTFETVTWPNTLDGAFSVNTPTVSAGPDVSTQGGTVNLNVGISERAKIELSLSALESIGKSKTLSNPKVLTIDNEKANIQQGDTFFIPTVSQEGTQTEEKEATLSLDVTPKIAPDGYVQLKVIATDDSLSGSGINAVINTKSVQTQALVKNGETLVLGGIFKRTEFEGTEGVPVLSKIPGLGWLFKTRDTIGPDVRELLIFITPTIVDYPG